MTIGNLRNVALLGGPGADISAVLAASTDVDRQPVGFHAGTRQWGDVQITTLFAPAGSAHEAERRATVRGADGVLFVLSAAHGVDAPTIEWWAECDATSVPRAVVMTHTSEGDYDEAIALCQRVFGPTALPLQYPLLADDDQMGGLIDLLTLHIDDESQGAVNTRPAEPEHIALLADARSRMLDVLGAEGPRGNRQLTEALRQAVCLAELQPILVLGRCDGRVVGQDRLLTFIADAMPSPRDRTPPAVSLPDGDPAPPLHPDPDGVFCAEILYRHVQDGEPTRNVVRIFSGTLSEDAGAGSITWVDGLPDARVGDTLSNPEAPRVLEPWPLPLATFPVTIEARDISLEQLRHALETVAACDPLFTLTESNGGLIGWCVDSAHAQRTETLLGEQLPGIAVQLRPSSVHSRETLTNEVHTAIDGSTITIRPLARGVGLRVTPEALGTFHGNVIGAPLTDAEVTVQSADTPLTEVRHLVQQTLDVMETHVLEPMCRVTVESLAEFTPSIIADLTKRGATDITSDDAPTLARISARLPRNALRRYAIDLRTLTHGSAHLDIRDDGFDLQPKRQVSSVVLTRSPTHPPATDGSA